MCGTCGRKRIGSATAARPTRCGRLPGLVTKGKTATRSSTTTSQKYGSQEPWRMPIDKGFNRLAWAVPYALGVVRRRVGRCRGRALVARARTTGGAGSASRGAGGRRSRSKLDEELRDLD